jgi:hypothetical protein
VERSCSRCCSCCWREPGAAEQGRSGVEHLRPSPTAGCPCFGRTALRAVELRRLAIPW